MYPSLRMEKFKIYFLLLTFLLASSACAVDRTKENGASGSTVVEAVVDGLRNRGILSADNNFLRRAAYAASKDGEDSNAYRAGFGGGIWRITQKQLRTTQISSLLADKRIRVEGHFSISWSQVTWSDLRKPLYSGIAAALYLQYVVEYYSTFIPYTVDEQGEFWKNHFDGTVTDFLMVRNLKTVSCDLRQLKKDYVVKESLFYQTAGNVHVELLRKLNICSWAKWYKPQYTIRKVADDHEDTREKNVIRKVSGSSDL